MFEWLPAFGWPLVLARILQPLLGVGMLMAFVWLILHYRTKSELTRRDSKAELDELRQDVNALRDSMGKLEELEEHVADLTLQIEDVAKRPLPGDHGRDP